MDRDSVRGLQRELAAQHAMLGRLKEQNAASQQLLAEQECEIDALRQDVATERTRRLRSEASSGTKRLIDDLETKLARLGKLEAGLVQQKEELKVFLRRREQDVQRYLARHGEDLCRYRDLSLTLHGQNEELAMELAAAADAREQLEAKLEKAEANALATEEAAAGLREGLKRSEEALGDTTKQLRKATKLLRSSNLGAAPQAWGDADQAKGAADTVVAYLKATCLAQDQARKDQLDLEERLRRVVVEFEACQRDRDEAADERSLLRDAVDLAMEASAKATRDANAARAALSTMSKMSKEEMQKLRHTVSRLREITAAEAE